MQTNEQLKNRLIGIKDWISVDHTEDRVTIVSLGDILVKYYYNRAPSSKHEMSFENFLNHFKPYNEGFLKIPILKGSVNIGRKDDSNKPRYSLLPTGTINQVVQVLEYGASDKYEVDNWQKIPDARRRFYDAAMRHIDAWWNGEKTDKESKLPHLAHAICCLLFLMWFDNKGNE